MCGFCAPVYRNLRSHAVFCASYSLPGVPSERFGAYDAFLLPYAPEMPPRAPHLRAALTSKPYLQQIMYTIMCIFSIYLFHFTPFRVIIGLKINYML